MDIQVISFHCVLKNKLGRVISSTFNHDVLTHDSHSEQEMLKGLSDGLRNLRQGEHRKISLTAEQAYGFYDTRKVIEKSREDFPAEQKFRIGDLVQLKSAVGRLESYRVVHLTADSVGLDGNHPLAGQDLVFEIEALQVREATPEEIFESAAAATPPEQLFH